MKKINQFNFVEYEKGNLELVVERVNNDIYGNPLYRIYPQGYLNSELPKVNGTRRNNKNKYYTIQSYSIDNSIMDFMENINGKRLYMNFDVKL